MPNDRLAEIKARREAVTAQDVDWLVGEVERLNAELSERWPFLSGVMYAAAEMANCNSTLALEIVRAAGSWENFREHCNNYDLRRFAKAVGKYGVDSLCKENRWSRP